VAAGRPLPFFYGFRSKVSDVKNAVVLLGFNAVRNAINSVSVVNALPKTPNRQPLTSEA